MNRSLPTEFSHPSFHGHIGVARVDITPPVGIYSRNWGAAKHDVADSIHRPLTMTALLLSACKDDAPLVFIDADKREYSNYYNLIFDKLKSGGYIIADNIQKCLKTYIARGTVMSANCRINFSKPGSKEPRLNNVLALAKMSHNCRLN